MFFSFFSVEDLIMLVVVVVHYTTWDSDYLCGPLTVYLSLRCAWRWRVPLHISGGTSTLICHCTGACMQLQTPLDNSLPFPISHHQNCLFVLGSGQHRPCTTVTAAPISGGAKIYFRWGHYMGHLKPSFRRFQDPFKNFSELRA